MFFRTARRSLGKADSTLLWGPPLEGQKIFQNEAFYIKTLVRKRPTLFSPFPFLEDDPSTFVGILLGLPKKSRSRGKGTQSLEIW